MPIKEGNIMAEENTITTIFKADISQFSSSAQQLNQYVNTINSEFNLATASMGKWSDNTDGLQAKLKQLNGVLEAQKAKLKPLEERYAQLVKEGKENTAEGKRLYKQLVDQQAQVKKTEKEIGHYSKSLEELQKAGAKTTAELKDLTKAQEEQGKSAGSVGSKIAGGLGRAIGGIATATAGAVTGFFALAESTRETRVEMGKLETAFNQAGFSAEQMERTYTHFNAVLGDTKKSTETLQQLAMFADTEQELTDYTNILTGVYAKLGDALPTESLAEGINHTIQLGEVQGSMADALEWAGVTVEDFNKQLAQCSNEEERNALINKTLTGLYGDASKQYQETNKDIIEAEKAQTRLGLAMADLGAIAEPIMTMLKNAVSSLLEAIKPFVELIGNGLRSAFEGSADGAKQFAEGLTGIVKTLLDKINNMLPHVVEIILQLIPSLIQALLDAIPTLINTLAQVISQIVVALGQMIPQIVTAVVNAIPLIVNALLDNIPVLFEACLTFFHAIIDALPVVIEQVLAMLPTLITSIIDKLISFLPQLVDGAIQLFMAIVQAIPIIIQKLIPQIPKIVNAIIDGLLKLLPKLLDACVKLLMAIIKAIPTIITSLVREIPKIVTTIITSLTSRIGDLVNGAIQLLTGIIDAIPLIIKELIPEIPTIIQAIVKGLLEGIPEILKVGKDLIKGLWEGIKSMGDWIVEKIKGFGKIITNGFKKIFGIKSPSKVFEDEIGKNLALGIGEGFSDEMTNVSKDMIKSMDKISPELNVGGLSLSNNSTLNQLADLIGSKVGGNVVNNYTIENSFKGMETTKFALHKSNLELKKIIGG